MAWNKKEEEKEEKKELYTEEDYKRFCETRKEYSMNESINGVLASPFEHYLHTLKVITIRRDANRFVVHDPEGFTKLSKMNARFEAHQYHKDKEMFAQYPEERTAFQQRIAAIRNKIAAKIAV